MGRKIYIGDSDNTARKVKKSYIGVDDIARKVKKAYLGVDDVARCIFSGGELSYYGQATALSSARGHLAGATTGNYMVFAGGFQYTTSTTGTVDAYNKSLTRSTPTTITSRADLAATSVGEYALFGGGDTNNSSSMTNKMEAYNGSLTKSTPSSLTSSVEYLAATTVGNYAIFAGGSAYSGYPVKKDTVDAYDSSLTKVSSVNKLSTATYALAATTIGDYALFGGGWSTSSVAAYNKSLTKTVPTSLSKARAQLTAATVGKYAIFAGGYTDDSGGSDTVDIYDDSLTLISSTTLSAYKYKHCGVSLGDYALFGGGIDPNTSSANGSSRIIEIFDASLTRKVIEIDSSIGEYPGVASLGNYALFAGGFNSSGRSRVDVFQIA